MFRGLAGDNAAMFELLLSFVPFFALVLLGWGAARGGILPLEGIGALNSFVLYFGLSAMVFRLAASGTLQQGGLGSLLLAYGGAGFIVAMLALAWASHAGLVRRDGGLAALVTAFPNTGFLGLPLLTGLLGPQAAAPVAATLVVDVLLLSSGCLAWAHSGGAQAGKALVNALKGALRNPLLLAMAAGMLAAWLGLVLPHSVSETVRLLSLSATPVALFTLGAMLARSQVAQTVAARGANAVPDSVHDIGPNSSPSPSPWLSALLKLALHPALVWFLGHHLLPAIGVPVPPTGLLVLTMAAALPSASNVAMLAEREGADTALVARIILWTTAAALLTLALWAHLLGVQAVAAASAT